MNGISAFAALDTARQQLSANRPEQAARTLMEHLRRNPNEPRGLAMLGSTAMRIGAMAQAEQFLRRALAAGERSYDTRRNLASSIMQQERLVEAYQLFSLLDQEGVDSANKATKAVLADKLGLSDEALDLREKLTESDGDKRPDYWVAYGHSLRSNGRVDDAVAAYRRALEVDYEHGDAWWGLASIKRPVLTDADIDAMNKTLSVAIDIRNSAPTHFALGRAFHDRGNYEQAFHHYSEANRLRAESLNYQPGELHDEVEETKRSVDAAAIARLPQDAVGEVTPIFVVSLPRSGSTLIEQMLGSHPQIEAIGELPYIPAILRTTIERVTQGGEISIPELIRDMPDEVAKALGADYLHRVSHHRKTDRPFFVDKLPHNWSNILFIRKILPQAKFIDIRRNALDCCFANFTQSFSSAHASSFTLEHIGAAYSEYVALMEHLDRVAPGMVHHVDYAKLVDDAEGQLRPAFAYLGLEWDPAVLEFHKLDRVVRTPSSEQVRRPLNREGIDVWKPYEKWLGPLRQALGPLAD